MVIQKLVFPQFAKKLPALYGNLRYLVTVWARYNPQYDPILSLQHLQQFHTFPPALNEGISVVTIF